MGYNAVTKAKEYFSSDFNCAQSVLRAFLESKDLSFDGATHITAGFGGGITGQGQICGAASGALMAIGMLLGRDITDVKEHKDQTYSKTYKFLMRFREEFDTEICSKLVGIDMTDNQARKEANEKGLFNEICPKFVEGAVKILVDMFPE